MNGSHYKSQKPDMHHRKVNTSFWNQLPYLFCAFKCIYFHAALIFISNTLTDTLTEP